jgi:hypothetical protein
MTAGAAAAIATPSYAAAPARMLALTGAVGELAASKAMEARLAGFASARDPKYTVVPQRERLEARK